SGGGIAIVGHVDDRLQHHVVVQVALAKTFGSVDQHGATDALLADVHAAQAVFEAAILRKQVGGVFPQALVEVVTEHGLQILDGVVVLKTGHALTRSCQASLVRGLRHGRRLAEARKGHSKGYAGRFEQGFPLQHRGAPFTGLPVTGCGAWTGGTCTSGKGRYPTLGPRSGGKSTEAWLRTSPSPGLRRAQPFS